MTSHGLRQRAGSLQPRVETMTPRPHPTAGQPCKVVLGLEALFIPEWYFRKLEVTSASKAKLKGNDIMLTSEAAAPVWKPGGETQWLWKLLKVFCSANKASEESHALCVYLSQGHHGDAMYVCKAGSIRNGKGSQGGPEWGALQEFPSDPLQANC